MNNTATCQICARLIKAGNGLIAHHGYKRPGQGWQTASCFGARYRPYEVACDALPPAIKSCEGYIARTTQELANWLANPPDTITVAGKHSYRFNRRLEPQTFARPENFRTDYATYRSDTYEAAFSERKYQLSDGLRFAEDDLKFLTKRLVDWKAPALA